LLICLIGISACGSSGGGPRSASLGRPPRLACAGPSPPAGVAAAAAVRAALGGEAQTGHLFAVGSWLVEVRCHAQGNRAQVERVRVHESDNPKALRVELAGGLLTLDLDEWEVRLAPALPPAPLAFDPAYTGQMPTDAAALASRLSAVAPGMDWMAFAAWTVGAAASNGADPPAPTAAAAALPAVRFDDTW
jgi:hypothetical protein